MADENAREALYVRVQTEGDDMVARELGDPTRPTHARMRALVQKQTLCSRSRTMDVRMDESSHIL